MSFSPWAILAIVLVGVGIAAVLVVHTWRTRVDRRRQQEEAAAANEKGLPHGNDNPHAQPPSDLGESGYGPGPGPYAVPEMTTTATPNWPSGVSSGDDSRGGSTIVVEGKHP